MTEPKSGALHSLQLTLARWKNPSAWDRVMEDDPLDSKLKGEWESTVGCNVSTDGTITIPIGAAITNVVGQVFTVRDAARTEIAVAMFVRGVGTGVVQPGQQPSTASPYGNEPYLDRALPANVPYPRNHKERRIFKSIEKKLPGLIRKAELRLGTRDEARSTNRSEEWNDEFWKMVSVKPIDQDRRKTKK